MKGQTVNLDPSDVLHIPGLGFDGLVGYSPIAMAKNAIGMAIACEEYGAKFFANGAAPGGVLEHPGTIKDPQKVRESWQSTFGGTGNANKIAVLEEGMNEKEGDAHATFICQQCGKEFIDRKGKKRKYCSQKCYAAARKKIDIMPGSGV